MARDEAIALWLSGAPVEVWEAALRGTVTSAPMTDDEARDRFDPASDGDDLDQENN